MLEKRVVRVIDKVLESVEFARGIQVVREACEALWFEKGKQLGGCSISARQPEVPDLGCVARRAKEVDVALSSLAETDSAGLYRLGTLDYDGFHQFCRRPREVLPQTLRADLCFDLLLVV